MFTKFKSAICNERGSVGTTFALSAIPLLGLAGLAVDVGMAYQTRLELQSAMESTALVLARRSVLNPAMEPGELIGDGKAMIDNKAGVKVTYTDFKVDTKGVHVQISGHTDVGASFSGLCGKESYRVFGQANARFSRQMIEVAVAVDMTLSMRAKVGGVVRIDGAKDAMLALSDAMSAGTSDKQNSSAKIALVPFDGQVKVLPSRDETATGSDPKFTTEHWFQTKYRPDLIDWDERHGFNSMHHHHLPEYQITGPGKGKGKGKSPFTVKTDRWTVFNNLEKANKDYAWEGCFEMRSGKYAYSAASPSVDDPESHYVPYFSPDQRSVNGRLGGNSKRNNYLPDQGPLCNGAAQPGVTDKELAATQNACKYDASFGSKLDAKPQGNATRVANPNGMCTNNDPVLPLTDDFDRFNREVKALKIDSSWGVTDQIPGFYWAWNAVTRGFPFNQAQRAEESHKAIIMLSDGENWIRTSTKNGYHSFGYVGDGRLADMAGKLSINPKDRLKEVDNITKKMCDAIKDDGNAIEVYYVFFNDRLSSRAADVGRHCASTPKHFIHASDADMLVDTFKSIGENLGKLRLTSAE